MLLLPLILLLQTAPVDKDAEIRRLEADNKLLKGTIAARDRRIQELEKELAILKTSDLEAENKRLRADLAAAKKRLSEHESKGSPLTAGEKAIVEADLKPNIVREKDFAGATLVFDGYVFKTDAVGEKFEALVVTAVSDRPMAYRDYQVQVRVRGDPSFKLIPNRVVRIKGTVSQITVQRGALCTDQRANNGTQGTVVSVLIEDASILDSRVPRR